MVVAVAGQVALAVVFIAAETDAQVVEIGAFIKSLSFL